MFQSFFFSKASDGYTKASDGYRFVEIVTVERKSWPRSPFSLNGSFEVLRAPPHEERVC